MEVFINKKWALVFSSSVFCFCCMQPLHWENMLFHRQLLIWGDGDSPSWEIHPPFPWEYVFFQERQVTERFPINVKMMVFLRVEVGGEKGEILHFWGGMVSVWFP